jgi:hypothetical protein
LIIAGSQHQQRRRDASFASPAHLAAIHARQQVVDGDHVLPLMDACCSAADEVERHTGVYHSLAR